MKKNVWNVNSLVVEIFHSLCECQSLLLARTFVNKFTKFSLVVEMGGIEPPSNTNSRNLLRV